jgi:ribonuclease HI
LPHVKFADDLTIWISHIDITSIKTELEENLGFLLSWAKKWRQNINIKKTECMLFSKKGNYEIDLNVQGISIAQAKEKRLLGVIFDENFSFNPHIQACCSRVKGQVAKISALTNNLRGANPELIITLYKTCIRPNLEYGYPIWCTVKDYSLLEKVHYQALKLAAGAMQGTPTAAMEVVTHVCPLDIRFDEVLLQNFLRISRKDDSDPLKIKILNFLQNPQFMDHKIITVLHKFNMAKRFLLGSINFDKIEPFIYNGVQDCLAPKIFMDCNLENSLFGSTNTRTQEQSVAALKAAQEYISSAQNGILAFTDGSALINPGPCGAGVAIYWNGLTSAPSTFKRSVSTRSSSYHGELQAIELALNVCARKSPNIRSTTIYIITDCQAALKAAVKCDVTTNFGFLLKDIQDHVIQLSKNNVKVNIYWTAGHISLEGNELADTLAKQAAVEAEKNESTCGKYIPVSEAKKCIKNSCETRWQKRWSRGKDSRYTHTLLPKVKIGGFKSLCERKTDVKYLRLKLGNTLLFDFMNRIMPDAYPTPNCLCGTGRQTINHYLIDCPLHNVERAALSNFVEELFIKYNVPPSLCKIDIKNLIGQPIEFSTGLITQLREVVLGFIRATDVNI